MQMALRLCAAAAIAAAVAWAMIALPGTWLLRNETAPAAVVVSPIAITPSPQDETRAATAALLIRHGLAKAAAAKEPPQPVASLPPAPAPAAAPTVAAPPVPIPQPAPPLPDTANSASDSLLLDRDEIAMLVKRGQELLANGDISSARLLLRRAAAAGNANAALALGETFDPQVIQRLGAVGAEPDAALARQWYQRASDLGSDAATQQLAKLAQGPQ
jgi:TPR repeat protein